MGGRGTSSGSKPRWVGQLGAAWKQQQTQQPQNQASAQQAPPAPTPVNPAAPMPTTQQQLAQMNDAQVTQILKAANRIDMPNHLTDRDDPTQKLIYTIGLNTPPQTMNAKDFSKFMRDNNISSSEIMSREVGGGQYRTTSGAMRHLTPQQVAQMWISDPYNYIGGKHGGQALGAGAYFDMNGGRSTGYSPGGVRITAILNPNTARVIDASTLRAKAIQWAQTHPQADKMIRRMANGSKSTFGRKELSLYATVLGYNVIKGGGSRGYHNVIDRSAVIVRQ